ncbi:Hypothetical predicted protein, partial [Prunus dulcis]
MLYVSLLSSPSPSPSPSPPVSTFSVSLVVPASTMRKSIEDTLAAHRNELVSLLSRYVDRGNGILQPHQMINELENVIAEDEGMQKLKDSPFSIVLQSAQEAIVQTPFVALALRPRPGVWEYVRVNVYELSVDLLSVAEYLRFKEELLDG